MFCNNFATSLPLLWSGYLTVTADAEPGSYTITVTSTVNTGKKGTAKITRDLRKNDDQERKMQIDPEYESKNGKEKR
ncbi:hypothetical protein [Cohnella abietis]|uniref:hypothetical protein n=1 Tax=Cohnella abietis TaxID=2507935 RepID=UPI00102E7BCE|nr:hypothetical protein [Cohnella abietis]